MPSRICRPPFDEPGAVEVRLEVGLLQLVHGMAGVLRLDPIVPGEEGQLQLRMTARLDREQAVLQFLPEAGGRPVLDGKASALGKLRIVAAVGSLQFVAEVKRARAGRDGACPGRRR